MQDLKISKPKEIKNPDYYIIKLAFLRSLPFLLILILAVIVPITPSDKAGIAFVLIPVYLIYFFIVSIPILQNPSLNKFGVDFSFFLTAFFEAYISLVLLYVSLASEWTAFGWGFYFYVLPALFLLIPAFTIAGFIMTSIMRSKLKKQYPSLLFPGRELKASLLELLVAILLLAAIAVGIISTSPPLFDFYKGMIISGFKQISYYTSRDKISEQEVVPQQKFETVSEIQKVVDWKEALAPTKFSTRLYSPDGNYLAYAPIISGGVEECGYLGGSISEVRIFDTIKNKELTIIKDLNLGFSLSGWSSDSQWLMLGIGPWQTIGSEPNKCFSHYSNFLLYNVSTGELITKSRDKNTFAKDLREICSSLFKNAKDVYLCDYTDTVLKILEDKS